MKKLTVFSLVAFVLALVGAKTAAAPAPMDDKNVFYVYRDKGDRVNHFIPSGWMGDYGDLRINDSDKTAPQSGKTSIKVMYSAQGRQGANWTGIYWQHPGNNWGSKAGGFNLTGYQRVSFWAKGVRKDSKPVIINEFKIGGITGDHGDSDTVGIGPVEVTAQWKKFTIDLTGKDLTHIIGGFCWAANRDNNPEGFDLYLDEIRYEK